MFARVARVASVVSRRTPSMGLRALQSRENSSLVSVLKREVEEEKGNCFEDEGLETLRAKFDCVASSNLTVERVRYLKDFAKDAEDETLYFGPNFIDLELDVQEKFYEYLADRKIDDELAQFINQFADLKEQREYLAFLQDAATFVKK
ncbi:hypothetical protein BBO99_00003000 [Phytophthora kernoviae]|uniref:Uncharacterized protein n=2 Tax=Phytophthora kernoviae TaxID=325452 RepID=A0A3R7HKS5_9STRA|nr:hypothetical protein G195_003461 [Phytophthora kernoviae 00238/432]KAG2528612.1 hypothetical protein JM16_002677 [Phytophthora kernoviae]KAG2529053.1 hypothetical protein JM18_002546 [Phytophthora kernoviae]RLN10116.1 hypothetical protein BBI17_003064 [Phytophthora kernoviae]RLN82317.1 hypothetical protein BBO99_00003000 [Phytophthora kernoviae]